MSSSAIASRSSCAPHETIRPTPQVTYAVRGDETVLADMGRGRYYALSPVGSRIWELLQPGITRPALLEQLQDEYDVPVEALTADVVAFLDALSDAHLITSRVS